MKIFRFCLENRIPVVYGIIPGLLTPAAAQTLREAKRRFPRLLDIAQHGWLHKDHSGRGFDKYEFGPRRSFELQKNDMGLGVKKMKRVFGRFRANVFVPPYHGYDSATIRAARFWKFAVFSAGKQKKERFPFLSLPAEISLNSYSHSGEPRPLSCKEMILRSRMILSAAPLCSGMVFHHRAYGDQASWNQLKRFLLYLKRLEAQRWTRLVLFSDLLKARLRVPGRFGGRR